MSRWIDADVLIMALRLEYPMMPLFKENQKEWEIKTDGYRKAEEVIRDAPSIDIVRCGECMHNGSYDTDCPFGWRNGEWNMPKPCDFCSYGEREGE